MEHFSLGEELQQWLGPLFQVRRQQCEARAEQWLGLFFHVRGTELGQGLEPLFHVKGLSWGLSSM